MDHIDRFVRANLKLRHLQLLVAMDDLRNVGRVADFLNVTQPAISKTLGSLEVALNAVLFRRTARGMEPTEHGECLIRHARAIVGRLSDAKEELREISEGRVTRVAMGVLPAASVQLVPRFIIRLEESSSAVAINVREGSMGALLPALRSGELDITVGVLPDRQGLEFESEVLYEDVIVAVVRHAHPLTRRSTLGWDQLAGYPMILPPERSITRGPIDEFFAQHGVSVARWHVESVSTATNVGLLQFSDSIGFTAAEIARHYVALGVLKVLPVNISRLTMRVGLTWMAERRKTVAHELMRRLMRETRDALLLDMQAFRHQVAAEAMR